jgi:hypothetical protein
MTSGEDLLVTPAQQPASSAPSSPRPSSSPVTTSTSPLSSPLPTTLPPPRARLDPPAEPRLSTGAREAAVPSAQPNR